MSPVKTISPARRRTFVAATAILAICFGKSLWALLQLAFNDGLYSFLPLIPLISWYLVWTRRDGLPRSRESGFEFPAIGFAAVFAALAALCFYGAFAGRDSLTWQIAAFLACFAAVAFLILGSTVMRAVAFPAALLLFLIPLPAEWRQEIDMLLQQGSASVAGALFQVSGTPVLQDEVRFQLPGINLQVAPECSGLHSTLVLLITSLVAGNLILKRPWQRLVLALVVIPLALARNGLRIFVIGELCVHCGPEMINSMIHRHGGPLFFVLSLIPLFLLLRYFAKAERRKALPIKPQENIMQPINRAFLTLFVAGLVVAAGTGCTAKVKATYHLQRADKYFDGGQYQQAEVEYLNVLRNDRENARAFGRLGLIYFDEGRYQRATPFLFRSCQLATNDVNFELKLGAICLAMGKYADARDKADFVLNQNPRQEEALLLLAKSSVTPKDRATAKERMQKLAQPSDQSALEIGLGVLAAGEHDFTLAEADFQRARTLDPKSAEACSALGNLYLAEGKQKAAGDCLKSAAELSPARSEAKVLYAKYEAQTGDAAAGISSLQAITKTAPDYVPAWIGLVEITMDEGKYDDASTLYDSAHMRDPDSYDLRLLGGKMDLARGKTAVAVAELERLAADYPQAAGVQYQAARAYLVANDLNRAAGSLNRTLALEPNFTDAALLLAQIQINNGSADQAVAALKSLVARQPQNMPAQLLLADADRAQGDFIGARQIYHQLQTAQPDNLQITLLMGSACRQAGDDATARQCFARVLQLAPDNLTAAAQLVDLDIADHKLDDAGRRAAEMVRQHPRQAEPLLAQAKVYLALIETNQVETTLLKAIELDPAAADAGLLLAQLYADAHQDQPAIARINSVVAHNPQNVPAWLLLGTIHSQDEDYSAAADAYEKVLAVNPKSFVALNNLAYLYSEHLGRMDRAYDLARQAGAMYPSDPSTADTLGWILCQKGQYPSSLSLLRMAASALPSEPEVQFHLGMVHYLMDDPGPAADSLGRASRSNVKFPGLGECQQCLAVLAIDPEKADVRARTILEDRIAKHPGDLIALSSLAMVVQHAGDLKTASGTYEIILKLDPRNARALIALAQIDSANDPAKAFALAKTAHEINPEDANISALAGRLALQAGEYPRALELLQAATQSQPANAEILFYYAQAAYSMGKLPEAQAAMQSALTAGLLASEAVMGRNWLDLMAVAANPTQAPTAEARVRSILKAQPDLVPGLVALALIETQAGDRAAAEKNYEKVLGIYPGFTPAQKALAILYAGDGANLERAEALAVKASENNPNDLELTKTLGIIAFQQKDFARAVRLLQASASERSDDSELFYYLGLCQFHLKNSVQSKDALRRSLELKLTGPQASEATQILAKLK